MVTRSPGSGSAGSGPVEFSGVDWSGAHLANVNLRGARFREVDLTGAVLRAADIAGVEIDAPWLFEGGHLLINGVDVVPLVDAALNERFPGREQRGALDPDGLRAAWAAVTNAWASLIARAEAMPAGTVDISVGDEWTFAQTLRHLVMAIDVWLGGAILGIDNPYHPIGQPNVDAAVDGHDPSVFSEANPPFSRVREVYAERVSMVAAFLADVTSEVLAEPRPHPWSPEHAKTVRSCLHTILEESWEHLRFAERDLTWIDHRDTR